jgi:hypothetical protein
MLRWDELVAENLHSIAAALFVNVFSFATDVLFIWLVARRRKNWPRWLMLFFFVSGIVFAPLERQWLRGHPVNSILIVVWWLAQSAAFFLIFTGNAREWFGSSQCIPPNPA